MKISCIVPVYKVEDYLRQCVESIINQDYRDIEVILVDDGSPDRSPQLCDELATEDTRIRVIHKNNGGLSDARNVGLSSAIGTYVFFIDSDDFWVEKDSLQKLVKIATDNPECDFIGFNGSYYYPNSKTFSDWVKYSEELLCPVSGDKALQLLVASGTFPMSACLKLIKRSFLVNNSIDFKVGQIAEDIPWFVNLLDKCDQCIFVNDYVYGYRQNVSGSISSSSGERGFNSLLDIIKTEDCIMNSRSFSEEGRASLSSFLGYEVCILMGWVHSISRKNRKKAIKELKTLSKFLKYPQNPKVMMVGRVYKYMGFTITRLMMQTYLWYRKHKS